MGVNLKSRQILTFLKFKIKMIFTARSDIFYGLNSEGS